MNSKFADYWKKNKKYGGEEIQKRFAWNERNAVIFMRLGMRYCMLHAIYPRIKGCLIITFRLGVESSISRVRLVRVPLGENKGQKKYHGVVEEGRGQADRPARNFELAIALRA